MITVLADYKYFESKGSPWAIAISRWRDGSKLVTSETEFTQVRGALKLSRTEKHLIFIHGDPQFGVWETALNSGELDAIVIRVSTEGHPPRPIEAPSIHLCSYTPEEFSNSARVAKFFALVDESPAQAIDLLLRNECSRVKALAIFLDCIAVAKETHTDNVSLDVLDMLLLVKTPDEAATGCEALKGEIDHLISGIDKPELSAFLEKLKSIVSTHGCAHRALSANWFLSTIGMDARAACTILTSILTRKP